MPSARLLEKPCRHGHASGRSPITGHCLECQNAYSTRWAAKNRALKNERSAAWNRNNRSKVRAFKSARRAGVHQASPVWLTKAQRAAILVFYKDARDHGVTVDHVVPLQGKTVCGLHVPWNLQLLTTGENSSKGNHFSG